MNIDILAHVFCTDGLAGCCTRVIVDPTTLRVTHLAVWEIRDPHTERLVPIDDVISTGADGIKLDCTRRKLTLMDEFVELTHLRVKVLDYRDYVVGLLMGGKIPKETVTAVGVEENIPPDELVMDSNTRVEGTDGRMGQVDGLEVEPASGRITSLVMREGHLWGQKATVIPAAQIERAECQAVYVKLDRQDIEALPVIPVGR